MEIINAIIENTNSPEIQAILAKLNPEEDILFTNESEEGSIEVEYIEPINNIKVIGSIPADIIATIKEKYGDDASIDIYDYIVTYDQGVYGLAVDIEVEKVDGDKDKPVRERKLPLPLLIVIGMATAVLTIILVIIKLIFSHKHK